MAPAGAGRVVLGGSRGCLGSWPCQVDGVRCQEASGQGCRGWDDLQRWGACGGHGRARAWCSSGWLGLSCAPFDLGCSRWGQGIEVMLFDKVREREVAGFLEVQMGDHVLAYANGVAVLGLVNGCWGAWGRPEVAGH